MHLLVADVRSRSVVSLVVIPTSSFEGGSCTCLTLFFIFWLFSILCTCFWFMNYELSPRSNKVRVCEPFRVTSSDRMPHVCVKGVPDSTDCTVFGLSQHDSRLIQSELSVWGHKVGQDGHQVSDCPLRIINLLSRRLGYQLVATSQSVHDTVVYTLHRPLKREEYPRRY